MAGADAGFAYHRVVGVVGAADRGCESPVFGILRPLDGCLPGAVGTFVFDRRVLEVFRGDHTCERRGVRPEVRVVVVGRARGDRRGDGLGVLQGDRGLLPCVVRDGEPEVGVCGFRHLGADHGQQVDQPSDLEECVLLVE